MRAWLCAPLLASALALGQEAPNEVIVTGRRPEVVLDERPGQSRVIRPEEQTRFDTRAQLGREAAITLPDTGRLNASGFAVPRFRGQDPRSTEIYLGREILQDPFTGLTLVDDLDLRAFGELRVHHGIPPAALSTVNPFGVLEFVPRRVTGPRGRIGTTVGQPYGLAAHGLGEGRGKVSDELTLSGRLYARRHVTSGRYRYYEDNGTPYNEDDDYFASREQNHRSSTQFVPWLHLASKERSLEGLGLRHVSRTGLPAVPSRLGIGGEERADSSLASLAWTERLGDESSLRLGVATTSDRRTTTDPEQVLLGESDGGFLSVSSKRGSLSFESAHASTLRYWLDLSHSRSDVSSEAGTQRRLTLSRSVTAPYAGAALKLGPTDWEAKAKSLVIDDDYAESATTDLLASSERIKSRMVHAYSLAGRWSLGLIAPYVQGGRSQRAPTLLEQFGNGGTVREAPEIDPEEALHLELGALGRDQVGALHWGLSVFQDATRDRILLLPSIAGTVRAVNIAESRVRGLDLFVDWTESLWHLGLGGSVIEPLDLTNADAPRVLPGVPEWTVSATAARQWGPSRWRWSVRHVSPVYRDRLNTIVIPSHEIHDVSVDAQLGPLALGLAVLNVFDFTDGAITSEDGEQKNEGRTAYGDFAGSPLPGRQWRCSMEASL